MSKNYNDVYEIKQRIASMVDSAYCKGYDTGADDGYDAGYDKGYEAGKSKGMCDAWACAGTVWMMIDEVRNKIFNTSNLGDIFDSYTASEAIVKIKEYEEKKKADDEIKVGDEVQSGIKKGIVIDIESDGNSPIKILWDEPLHCNNWTTAGAKSIKTGRHFDIQSLLNQIRGGNNSHEN